MGETCPKCHKRLTKVKHAVSHRIGFECCNPCCPVIYVQNSHVYYDASKLKPLGVSQP